MRGEKVAIVLKDDRIINLTNISKQDNTFVIDAEEIYPYLDKIKAIIHTHEDSCEPSIIDKINMIYWNYPWIIISKNCIKAYIMSNFSIFEIDINTLIPKELNDFFMKFLQ